jgi:hypothetical protein
MGLIKSSHLPQYRDCRHTDESARQAHSWMTRPRPGIQWRPAARAAMNRPGSSLTSFKLHHSS